MKIDIDTAIAVALISGIISALVTLGTKILSRSVERAQASKEEGDAATKLSDAAATQIKTYNEEIVNPLKERIDGLEDENKTLRSLLVDDQSRYDLMRRSYDEQIESLQLRLKNLNKSLDSQRDQIAILMEQSENKDRTIRRMQEEIEQLQRENLQLRAEVNKLRSENDVLKTRP